MKLYERELAEARHEVTKKTLKWSNWHASWEHALQEEAQERVRHGAKMTMQIQVM